MYYGKDYGGSDMFIVDVDSITRVMPITHKMPHTWTSYDVYEHVLIHEIGHNIIGFIDQDNRYKNENGTDYYHAKWPEFIMYEEGLNYNSTMEFHPETWEEIQRDGVGISFETILKW